MTSELFDRARYLDALDPLAPFRQRFQINDPDLIYLDGNSLGRLPKTTADHVKKVVEHQWGDRLIRSWNEGWMQISEQIGDKIATILGASPGEIILADSTSVNLYKLALAAMLKQSGRHKIITDDMNFPSDIYILESICHLLGKPYQVEIITSDDDIYGPAERIQQAVDQGTALVSLSHTTFKSGFTYDMESITRSAHKAGALVLWDLSHSAGVVPISLNQIKADLAVGCTYKYLNGGPGSPAFLYVRKDHQRELANPISGWFGHKNIFDFDLQYAPADGIRRFLSGTQPIISSSAVQGGIALIQEAGLEQIREKSVKLTQYLIELWQTQLVSHNLCLKSPAEKERRGSHVTLAHPEGQRIALALINQMKIVPDFREPDNIRFGLSPLYTTFEELYTAVDRIRIVVEQELYKKYEPKAGSVT